MGLLKYTVSLLVIMDPIFAALMVAGMVSAEKVRRVAFKSSMTVLISSVVTVLTGDSLLKLMGVNIYSIKIFGGLILLHMAFQMLQAHPPKTKHTDKESQAAASKEDISVIPIGIPILFGPGAFTTLLIFREESRGNLFQFCELAVAIFLTVVVIYLILINSAAISRRLGTTGMNVTVRVFGLFVGALGAQFVVDGVKHLWVQG
ncbi:MAG: MarC family protein [Desulfurobacteriaceae bacterium]